MPNASSSRAAVEREVVEAWSRLLPEHAAPDRVEILEGPKEKKTVCRLEGAGHALAPVIAKRYRLAKGLIERAIYTEVLARLPAPALHCYGLVREQDDNRCWLFLEDAGGDEYAPFDDEHRALAARWLALLHTSAATRSAPFGLPDRGADYYLECLRAARRAIEVRRGNLALTADDCRLLDAILSQCGVLETRWENVERLCAGMPRTIVHGDFVKKNLRVRATADGQVDLLVFDWGSAGWGVPAVDLAQPLAQSGRFSANPDLAVYWAAVRDEWPACAFDTIQKWANVGSVFRSLVSLRWAALSLGFAWVEAHMVKMQIDHTIIERAMRAGSSEGLGA